MSDREIINTWDQILRAGGDRITFRFRSPPPRGGHGGWLVSRFKDGKELVVDPKAHWKDRPAKLFRGDGRKPPQEMLDWIAATFGPRDFVRNRMRNYVEREVNERFPIHRSGKPSVSGE